MGKAFVVDYRDLADIKIGEFESEEAARAACPSEGGASVVTSEEALNAFEGPILLAVYNRIRRGPPIKKFHDKQTGMRKTWVLLEHYDPSCVNPSSEPQTQEAEVTKPKTKRAPRRAKAKTTNGHAEPRGVKTKEIARLLQRKNGCTAAEVLEATGWPSVSMPAMSKACGLKLRKEKVKGEKTRYWGE